MYAQGAVFHHKQLKFKDGVLGKKYLILLNLPRGNDPYLFVKATSQPKQRPRTAGCIKERSLFFISGGKTAIFPKDTWIQLHETYPIDCKAIHCDRDITMEGSLDSQTAKLIIDCLFAAEEDNLTQLVKDLLRSPVQSSLNNLESFFNKNRC